jgi:3-hydroxyacyl-CoA dehydrogenase
MKEIRRITVVGSGVMGSQIAMVSTLADFRFIYRRLMKKF